MVTPWPPHRRLLHERGGMEVEGSGSVDENATHPSAQHAGCKWGAFTCGQKLRDGSAPRRGKEERDRERVAAAAAAAALASQLAASGARRLRQGQGRPHASLTGFDHRHSEGRTAHSWFGTQLGPGPHPLHCLEPGSRPSEAEIEATAGAFSKHSSARGSSCVARVRCGVHIVNPPTYVEEGQAGGSSL